MTAKAQYAMAAEARSVRIESEIGRRNIKLSAGTTERCGPCPVCGGRDRFAINVKKQVWNCRGCATGGDASASQPLDLSWGATEAKLAELNRNTLDPLWAQREEQETQNLYNQGISPGSQAYDTAMRQFQQQKSDAYNQMFLQGHQTAISDILQQYNAPINAAAAWRSGGQIAPYQPNMGFVQTPQAGVQPPDYSSLVEQNYKTQATANAQGMGGLFGLGGDLLKFGGQFLPVSSDRNDKTDIEKLGEDEPSGIDVYAYRYKDDPKSYPKVVGPMAQDIERKAPGSTKKIGGHRVIMEVR